MIHNLFSPYSPFPAFCILAIAMLSISLIAKVKKFDLQAVKYEAFDGLKGYLSLVVFICHSSTWYFYLRTDKWVAPANNLYDQIGQTSIYFFFIMTGFLFCLKLINGKTNWIRLYVSRLVRLFPLYFVAVLVVFFIAAILTDFTFGENQSWLTVLSQLKKWLMFSVKDDPDVNGLLNTRLILCKVTWTLRYEWIFYLALPIIGLLFIKNKIDYIALALSALFTINVLMNWPLGLIYFTPFVGGIISNILLRYKKVMKKISIDSGSFIILTSTTILLLMYAFSPARTYEIIPSLLINVIFFMVVNGSTLFGVLSYSLARRLGQLSYGIYLFHGILFFILFRFILGFDYARGLSSLQHWVLICLLTPLLVFLAFMLHIYVEIPSLKYSSIISEKIIGILDSFKQKMTISRKQVSDF